MTLSLESPLSNVAVDEVRPIKVICIGAGFSGILTAIRLPQKIPKLELIIYDKNHDLGGTWLENQYPGVGCDVPSHSYQFAFAPNPHWSKFYSSGAEIHQYLKDVAWRYDVEKYMKFQHCFQGAKWDEATQKWMITVTDMKANTTFIDSADVFIRATGVLNKWKWPGIKGLHSFQGNLMHTAAFDPNCDWHGKRVALIGAGSTGIQVLPNIQKKASKVFHYMRGKTWISPVGYGAAIGGGGNFEYSIEQRRQFEQNPDNYLEYRHRLEEVMNKSQLVTFRDTDIQKKFWIEADKFMKGKLEKKPEIYESLRPSFPPGCRRLTPGPGYLEALLEDNVEFIGAGVTEITETGIHDSKGGFHEVDVIICATGFDYTYLTKDTPIIGRDGISLDDMYNPFPQSYLGITVPNMPNYFTYLGPAGIPASGSFVPTLELIVKYITKCIQKLQVHSYASMDPRMEALEHFNTQADRYFEKTIFTYKCSSFFKGDKDEGRVSMIWPGSVLHYMSVTEHPRWEDYKFTLLPELNGKLFSWFGNGLTRSQSGEGKITKFLDEIDVPPMLNIEPRKIEHNGVQKEMGGADDRLDEIKEAVSTLTG